MGFVVGNGGAVAVVDVISCVTPYLSLKYSLFFFFFLLLPLHLPLIAKNTLYFNTFCLGLHLVGFLWA